MQHLSARQRTDTGKWHYTRGSHPTGYCAPYKACPTCEGRRLVNGKACTDCQPEGVNFPTGVVRMTDEEACPGHDTAEEACEHYKQYLLDKWTGEGNLSHWADCQVCGAPTKQGYWVGAYRFFTLCAEHHTREQLAELLIVGESWES